MKKIVALILAVLMVLGVAGCASDQPSSSSSPSPTPTAGDSGTELSSSSLYSKAESYCKNQFKTTYGGYQITKFDIASSSTLTGDDLYAKFKFSGTYTYKDQYGQSKTKPWDMYVYVYKWSKNPDGKREIKTGSR